MVRQELHHESWNRSTQNPRTQNPRTTVRTQTNGFGKQPDRQGLFFLAAFLRPAGSRLFVDYAGEPRFLTDCRVRGSRRAEAVETGEIIRPLGIAEIGPAAGKGVGFQWRPGVIGQIRAGFDHDRGVRCPGDDEAELVGFHAKAGADG